MQQHLQSPHKEINLTFFAKYLVGTNVFARSVLANNITSKPNSTSKETVAVSEPDPKIQQRSVSHIKDDKKAEEYRMGGQEKATSSNKGRSSGKAKGDQAWGTQTKNQNTAVSSDSEDEGPRTQLEAEVVAHVTQLITATIRDQMPHLVDAVVRETNKKLRKIAQDAAKLEIDKYIEEVNAETEEEKVQCLVKRIGELSQDTLERVFLQRSVVEKLKKLVEKAETEMSLLEWEEL
ncbi:uncharacterized protein PG998_012731 [Apiospora kogelbergensis]